MSIKKTERNTQIMAEYLAGWRVTAIAEHYGISAARVYAIVAALLNKNAG